MHDILHEIAVTSSGRLVSTAQGFQEVILHQKYE